MTDTLTTIGDGDLTGKGVIGLEDAPGLAKTAMQAKFEEILRSVVIPKLNVVIGKVNDLLTAADVNGVVTATDKASWNAKADEETYIATITTAWTGTTAPYSQVISVAGMTDCNAIVSPVPDSVHATALAELAAWQQIMSITTAADCITVYATEKTTQAIDIQLKVVK